MWWCGQQWAPCPPCRVIPSSSAFSVTSSDGASPADCHRRAEPVLAFSLHNLSSLLNFFVKQLLLDSFLGIARSCVRAHQSICRVP